MNKNNAIFLSGNDNAFTAKKSYCLVLASELGGSYMRLRISLQKETCDARSVVGNSSSSSSASSSMIRGRRSCKETEVDEDKGGASRAAVLY